MKTTFCSQKRKADILFFEIFSTLTVRILQVCNPNDVFYFFFLQNVLFDTIYICDQIPNEPIYILFNGIQDILFRLNSFPRDSYKY